MISLKLLLIAGLIFRKVICMRKNDDDYHYRLSENVVPLIYNVTLALNTTHDNLYIHGNATTTIQIINATTFINFHCSEELYHSIKEITLYGTDLPYITTVYHYHSINFINDTQITNVKYSPYAPLLIGKYKLEIKFAAHMVDKENIIKHEFTDGQNQTWFILTSMKPTLTRYLFPCWDEPALKARFNISINYDRNYIALSNTPIEKLSYADDTVWTHFIITPVMSTYQLAIVLTNYISIVDTYGSTWYIRQRIQQVKFGRNISNMVASYLLNYTTTHSTIYKRTIYINAPFLNEVGNKAIGKFGLSIYNERYFAYNQKLDMIDKEINITILVAQQIAHEWFGNLISPSWWTHMWLNNVLATFFGYYALSEVYPDSQMRHFFLFQLQQLPRNNISASCIDTSKNIETPQDINKLYLSNHSSACYMKGAALMFMLKNIISEDVFQKVIIDYLTKYQYSSVTPNDFWTCLQTAIQKFIIYKYDYHVEIKKIMENWLTQTKYPVVYFERDDNTGQFLLTQEEVDDEKIEWWSLQTNKEHNKGNKWSIPISITTQSDLEFSNIRFLSKWLKPVKGIYGIKYTDVTYKRTDWIIINVQHVGYYRVNYDRTNWRRLVDYLNSDQYMKIHVLNRAHLIDDAYFFVTKKKLEPIIFWDLIKYLKKEKDYTPWYSIKTILSDMSPLFLSSDSDIIKEYITDILNVLLKDVGYQEKDDETESVKLKRLLAVEWTCRLGLASCRLRASTKLTFDKISPGIKERFLPWWKSWTPCIGMMGVHIAIWKKLFCKFFETEDIEILEQLTCSEDPEIIIYYLNYIANGCKLIRAKVAKFKMEDCTKIYDKIIKKHAEKEIVLNSILENFYAFKASNISTLSGLGYILTNLYSERQVKKLRTFITNNATIMEEISEYHTIFNSTMEKRLQNIYEVNSPWLNDSYFL